MLGWGVADVERWCPETRLGRAGVRLTEVQTAVVLEGEVKVPTSGLLLLCSVTGVLEDLGTTAFVLVGGGCCGRGGGGGGGGREGGREGGRGGEERGEGDLRLFCNAYSFLTRCCLNSG